MMMQNLKTTAPIPYIIIIQLLGIFIFNVTVSGIITARLIIKYKANCSISSHKVFPGTPKTNKTDGPGACGPANIHAFTGCKSFTPESFSDKDVTPLFKYSIWSKSTFS